LTASSKGNILLIEGKRIDRPSFTVGLMKKGFDVTSVPNGSAAIQHLAGDLPHLVVIDADSMRTSGKRICQAIRDQVPEMPIVLVLGKNSDPSEKIDANEVLVLPFTQQKLHNRIRPFLPLENVDIVRAGPIELDIKHRLVRCNGKQSRITPRLVILLRTLMEKHGEVVQREDLFKKVWETNYTGDTRTLDVHISWLRISLGDDPRKPRLLKTLRGVGYRLDVE
jgi:DNA-binding response OmpR family regulator